MTTNLVETLLERIKERRRRVVIIGDAILDHWIYGNVLECQDGCQRFVQTHSSVTPGGADNAGRSLEAWGAPVDVHTTTMTKAHKYRFIDTTIGSAVFRWDDEMLSVRNAARCSWSRELALEMVGCAGAVLLSDYDKGFLLPEFIHEVTRACVSRGIPCVADCKRAPDVYRGAILKGNSAWKRANSVPFVADVVVTRGADLPSVNGIITGYDMPPVNLVNHVGAGDCFAAHLTLGLAYGFTLLQASVLAHSAGRCYVQQPESRPPLPSEVEADLALGAVVSG